MTCIRSIRWLSGQIASISQSGVQNLGIFLRCQILKSQPLFHFFISSTFIFWYWYNMYQGSQKYILQYLLTDEAYNNSRLFLLASELGASATRISRTLLMYSTKPRVGELIRECDAGWIGVPHDAVRAESYVIFFFVFFPCSYPTFESTTAHHSHGDRNFHVTVSFFDANNLRIGHRRSHIPIPDSYRVRTVFILYRVQD